MQSGSASSQESACSRRRHKRPGFDPWVGKIPSSRKRQPNQYSCLLENPKDRGAWQAIVHGAAKSRTQLSTHARAEFLKNSSHSHMRNLKYDTNEPTCETETQSHLPSVFRPVVAKEDGVGGGMIWKAGVSRYNLLGTEGISPPIILIL